MIIFYNKRTRNITGVSMIMNDTSTKLKEPTLKSSYPKNTPPDIAYFFTPNDATIANELWAYKLKFNKRGKAESVERKPPLPYIQLSTDAPEKDGHGIPEIVADGKQQCNITASVRDHNGSILTHFREPVTFKTTGGVLFDREVKCKNGVAKTTLRSVEETLTPTITATAPGCVLGEMEIEFVLETVFK